MSGIYKAYSSQIIADLDQLNDPLFVDQELGMTKNVVKQHLNKYHQVRAMYVRFLNRGGTPDLGKIKFYKIVRKDDGRYY